MGWPRMGGDPWGGGSLRWAEGSVAGAAWAGQPQWTELANAPPSAGPRPAQGEGKALQGRSHRRLGSWLRRPR